MLKGKRDSWYFKYAAEFKEGRQYWEPGVCGLLGGMLLTTVFVVILSLIGVFFTYGPLVFVTSLLLSYLAGMDLGIPWGQEVPWLVGALEITFGILYGGYLLVLKFICQPIEWE